MGQAIKTQSAVPKKQLQNAHYSNLLLKEKLVKRNGMHSFHRYFGKLIPAIPAFAIKNFTEPGDWVLDSFCGSGTTLLEAKNLDRNAHGVDINPLAVFTARVKTTKLPEQDIVDALAHIKKDFTNDNTNYADIDEPYCVNINHWFKPHVKSDLLKLRHYILAIDNAGVRDFFLASFSAFLRGVSNADPMHVFPGYSKRLRKLDAEGKRTINVWKSFENAVKKRTTYMGVLPDNKAAIKVSLGTAKQLPSSIKKVKLIVINPPYISSIRYLETMKLEMGWLGFIHNQQEYVDLDKHVIGTERFYKKDLGTTTHTGFEDLDQSIDRLMTQGHLKMAKVVSEYFHNMKASFQEMHRVLEPGGHIVIKISDSKVRTERISTHKLLVAMAEGLGMKTIACFKDDFEANSRSLLTARNSYSGIMNYDWILIFRK